MNTNKRRDKAEGHMAALIRRKMTQRNHGDDKKFKRNEKHKRGYNDSPSFIYLSL